ncbi:MAG: baseplate J/gp47 family protein [Oscillospiraceae bacterium]|nr:baseplate J/gp47 family protein [Oscillospiraceae bacterium]
MYKNMTFGFILSRMLDRIPDDVDKREGSVIYDALAPVALELAQFYSELDNAIDETFADTAGREMLIRRAAERAITPYPATFATIKGEFNITVPANTLFTVLSGVDEEELIYRVTENIEGLTYRLVCTSKGAVGNRSVGDLLPVNYIEGLTSAKITGLLIPGEDEEETEHLRKRYFESIENYSYGGNVADYRRMVLALPGVGGVKITPSYNGGGHVRLSIITNQWDIPSNEMITDIKGIIDPARNPGKGYGLAPIGHNVTVIGVMGMTINVSAKFIMSQGVSFEDTESDLNRVLDEYFREFAVMWEALDDITLSASQLEVKFLNVTLGKIRAIENLKFNNSNDRNYMIYSNHIPLRGEITNVD